MRRVPLLGFIVLCACIDIPGMEAGAPCNSQGVCAEGLFCEEGTCRSATDVSWVRMNRPGTPSLHGVWGTGSDNVYAAGSNGTILHYQGQGLDWVDTGQSNSSGVTSSFTEIWGNAPDSIWAVGQAIVHFDGSVWLEQQVLDTTGAPLQSMYLSLSDIHGEGDLVVAVGSDSYKGTMVLRYNSTGKNWEQVDVQLDFSPRAVWVVQGQIFVAGDALHVKHFDGQSWKEQNLDLTTAPEINALWGTKMEHILAVGPKDKVMQYDGQSWKTLELKRSAPFIIRDIAGKSAEDFYLVGDGTGYPEAIYIEHCTPGCSANPVPEDAARKLYGVFVTPDGQTVYAVGGEGIILRRQK